MATAIDEVRIKITADQKDLDRELKKAGASTKKFSKQAANDVNYFGNSVGKAKSMIGTAAIAGTFVAGLALAAGKLIKMGESAILAGDQIGKMSSKLGITAEELQEYQIIADAAGVSTETFNMAFQRFTRRVGEVKNGTGELKSTFEELDISVTDAEGNFRTTADLFDEFGRKVNATSDANQRLAFTMKGMDSEGVALINMFKISAQEQQKLIDTAKSYGAVISNDVVASMEKYATELGLINKGTEALGMQTDAVMAPLTLGWAKLKNEIAFTSLEFLHFLGLIDDNAILAKKRIADLELEIADMTKAYEKMHMNKSGIDRALEDKNAELAKEKEILATIEKKYEANNKPTATGVGNGTAGIKETTEALDDMDRAMDLVIAQFEELDEAEARQIAGLQDVTAGIKETEKATKEAEKAQEDYAASATAATTSLMENWSNTAMQMDQATAGWLNSSADALTDFVMTGKLSFADLANSIIKDLIRIQIQQQIVGMIGSSLGGFASTGATSGGAVDIGFAPTSSDISLGRAGGGSVSPGQVYPVGERGMEYFVPDSAGKIVNNSDSQNLGGGSVPVSVNIKNEGTAQSPTSATANMRPDGMVIDVVLNDLRRDGPISQGMQKTFRVQR